MDPKERKNSDILNGRISFDEDRHRIITDSIDVTALVKELDDESGSVNFHEVQATSFGRLLEALPIPAMLLDQVGRVVFVNKAWEKIAPSPEKLLKQPFSLLLSHPQLAQEADKIIKHVFATRRPYAVSSVLEVHGNKIFGRIHFRSLKLVKERSLLTLVEDLTIEKTQLLLTKRHEKELRKAHDQLEQRVEERTTELREANEKLTVEITERSKAEQALAASEEKYRVVVENAREGICVFGGDKIRFINRAGTQLLGYSQEQLLNKPWSTVVHSDDKEIVRRHHDKKLNNESTDDVYSHRVIDAQGKVRWLEVNSALIQWESRPAILAFLTDITAKLKMEEEQTKMAKLESLGILAGGIAHDFNNLLTAIAGNINLTKINHQAQGIATGRLEEAERACKRAEGLTKQLLTFSKGGRPVKRIADIAKITREAAAFALGGSNVNCEFTFPLDLRSVEVDEGQITQVVNNLVINADHAMPDGGTIKVSAENLDVGADDGLPLSPGPYIRISVSDRGVGIPEETIPMIFDPYFSTKEEGTGLGLATALSITEKHGGLITADSKPGKGTVFHVYLPAIQDHLGTQQDEQKGLLTGEGRILVMDDESAIRDLLSQMLTLLGYSVVTARDGSEAIEQYEAERNKGRPFDCVIMDLTIPGGMGGMEAIQELRGRHPDIKAIVSSGYSTDSIMSDYPAHGFDGVCTKPYSMTELAAAIKRVLA